MCVSHTLIKIKNKFKKRQEFPIPDDDQVKVFREDNSRWRLDSKFLRSVLSKIPQFCETGFIKAKLNSYKCVNCYHLLSSFQKCIKIEKKTPKDLLGTIQWSTARTNPLGTRNLALPQSSRTAFPTTAFAPPEAPPESTYSHSSH